MSRYLQDDISIYLIACADCLSVNDHNLFSLCQSPCNKLKIMRGKVLDSGKMVSRVLLSMPRSQNSFRCARQNLPVTENSPKVKSQFC